MIPSTISSKYGNKLMISGNELKEYSKGRNEMFVIEFENFEKFNNPVNLIDLLLLLVNIFMKMNMKGLRIIKIRGS